MYLCSIQKIFTASCTSIIRNKEPEKIEIERAMTHIKCIKKFERKKQIWRILTSPFRSRIIEESYYHKDDV